MKTSEEIKNISNALFKFQSEVESIDRNSKGYGYKYASLENVLETIRTPLQNAGLVFSQFPEGDYSLTTLLVHPESGEYFENTSQIIPTKDDAQGRGSAITYLRRYHLVSILGLIVEDDDAKAAVQSKSSPKKEEGSGKEWLNKGTPLFKKAISKLANGETTVEKIESSFLLSKEVRKELLDAQKKEENEKADD